MAKTLIHLKADMNSGEGSVKLTSAFEKEDDLFQMDVLRDWIYDLQNLYFDASKEFYRDLSKRSKKVRKAKKEGKESYLL